MSVQTIESQSALGEYLQSHIEGFDKEFSLTKFAGGQSNPTFKLTSGEQTFVLRKQPSGKLLKSAHAVDREFRVLEALFHSAVPVAKPYLLCTDRQVIGEMFYIMEFCEGNIFWDASLSEITSPELRSEMYDSMNKTLAAIHSVNVFDAGLADFGKPGNYFQRQLTRWIAQYQASELDTIEEMHRLYRWLEHHLPEDDGKVALVHGDYRLDNLIFKPNSADVQAVLDWELSTLGHPLADLAYQCMQLRLPKGFGNIDGLANLDREALGIPSEQQYVASYCQRMNITHIDNWPFYLAFSFFRLAAIVQGVAKRATLGNASNKKAGEVGSYVRPLAQMALAIISE